MTQNENGSWPDLVAEYFRWKVVYGPQVVKKPATMTYSTDQSNCCICLEQYESGDKLSKLTCGHLAHAKCIADWKVKHLLNDQFEIITMVLMEKLPQFPCPICNKKSV